MANIKIVFQGTEDTKTEKHEMECFLNTSGSITLKLIDSSNYQSAICLDVSTAIKFSKTLRTEINKAKEVQGE